MPRRKPSFGHSGDAGDIIACLPIIRSAHGGHLVIFDRPEGRRESMKGARYESIRPLLEAQPYVESVQWSDTEPAVNHDLSVFRRTPPRKDENLTQWQARHICMNHVSFEPWLTVTPDERAKGRVVIARSARYHNPNRMWQKIVSRNKDALFVGLPEEHKLLQGYTGARIQYCPTRSLMELAQVIAGARMFIGNQSCPWWIACALGVPCIQETWPHAPNSMVDRPGLRYWINPPFVL